MLDAARADGLRGDLMFYMVDGRPGSAVQVLAMATDASVERCLLLDRKNAARVGAAAWSDFPVLAKAVATGVDVHEGRYFGAASPWLNTAFAAALAWLSLTGAMSWWRRKPADALGVPPRPRQPWPRWLRAGTVVVGVALPLLGASAAALWLGERAWLRVASRGRA